MRNFKITVTYDGGRYSGFQRQREQATVQGVLEEKLSNIVETPVKIVCAGRTDAGVHALGQVISVKLETHLDADIIQVALNSTLPKDIRILDVKVVPQNFHARHSALERHYQYLILNNRRYGIPFWEPYSYHVHFPLDLKAMQDGASYLAGSHDFSAFRAGGYGSEPGRCTLFEITCEYVNEKQGLSPFLSLEPNELIIIRTRATNYLHNMIRNIVGTLVEVGSGKRIPREMEVILESRDRRLAGATAPPEGLYLTRVIYGDGLD